VTQLGKIEPGELIFRDPPLGQRVEPVTCMRSTWVVASVSSLRQRGHYEPYLAHLGDQRDRILSLVAGVWLPIEVARAHYKACEALRLSIEEQVDIGRGALLQAQHWVSPIVKLMSGAGATPWSFINYTGRIWRRAFDGGVIAAYRLGPKEGQLEYAGCELLDIDYFRNGLRGVIDAFGSMFSTRHYTHDRRHRHGNAVFRLQWA
jgi:hypothetical protein